MDHVEEFYAFLGARLDEDDETADTWQREQVVVEQPADVDPLVFEHEPWVRLRAETEVKRQILKMHQDDADWAANPSCPTPQIYQHLAGAWLAALRLVASIYSNHPDYRPEWAPEGA